MYVAYQEATVTWLKVSRDLYIYVMPNPWHQWGLPETTTIDLLLSNSCMASFKGPLLPPTSHCSSVNTPQRIYTKIMLDLCNILKSEIQQIFIWHDMPEVLLPVPPAIWWSIRISPNIYTHNYRHTRVSGGKRGLFLMSTLALEDLMVFYDFLG